MGILAGALSLALASHAISIDQYPLRQGCDAGEPVVATLRRGDPVEIRFALAGSGCYKVMVQSGGKALEGYVSPDAISGVDAFERERRAAPALAVPVTIRAGGEALPGALSLGAMEAGTQAARLLEENRPLAALGVLEPVVRSSPKDAGLLSLAGYAAYRGDDMRTALDYLGRSLELQPDPVVQRLYDRARQEAQEDKSGERLVGTRFQLRYNRADMPPETARAIVGVLEQEFSRVSLELGCRLDERIVAVVQSPEEYRRTTDAAEWSAGQYTGRIRVAAVNQSRLDETTRRTLAHEVVHACLAGLGDYPIWLHEGLAQKLSGETLGVQELAEVRRLAKGGQLPSLSRFSQTWARMSRHHANVAYSTALAAINLFYEHHSGLGVRNLLRNPHLLEQVEADLNRRLRE